MISCLGMTRTIAAGAAAIATMIVTGCSGPVVPEVDWDDYDPQVQERITRLEDRGACPALQREFDLAETHGEPSLMQAIHEAMQRAGCYAS